MLDFRIKLQGKMCAVMLLVCSKICDITCVRSDLLFSAAILLVCAKICFSVLQYYLCARLIFFAERWLTSVGNFATTSRDGFKC